MRGLLLLLALAFCVTGCRDSLVDEPLPVGEDPPVGVEDPPPTGDPEARSIYVKGFGSLRLNATGSYRAESMPDAVRYVWTYAPSSTGSVTGTPTGTYDRLYALTGARLGVVHIEVVALDARSQEIGVGTKTIEVVR